MPAMHTKGPWNAVRKLDAHCNNRFLITGISRNDGRVAHVADDVVEHNVPLITSATEMLTVLEQVVSDFDSQKFEVSFETMTKVRAVIARASGCTA